jgi:hypothetical protein
MLVVVLTLPWVAQASAVHVTICHRTGSATNPYVRISPSAPGVFHGHLDHSQVGNGLGGDIIPTFEYKGHSYSKSWGSVGQAIWNNGCQVPKTRPTQVKTPPLSIAFTGVSTSKLVVFSAMFLAFMTVGSFLLISGRRMREVL